MPASLIAPCCPNCEKQNLNRLYFGLFNRRRSSIWAFGGLIKTDDANAKCLDCKCRFNYDWKSFIKNLEIDELLDFIGEDDFYDWFMKDSFK